MNRSQLRGMVRLWLNEAAEGFWLNPELNNCLDIANQVVNTLIRSVKEDYFVVPKTFATTANTKSYTWPTDFAGIRRMEHYSTSNPTADIAEIRQLELSADTEWAHDVTDKPESYNPFGDHFDLWPIPDAVYPIRIFYDQIKANFIDDSSVPSSPAEYHDMVAIWATILALPKDTNRNANDLVALWQKREDDLVKDLKSRASSGPQIMEESWMWNRTQLGEDAIKG